MDKIRFYNGLIAPTLAYGTWLIKNEDVTECTKNAFEAGYRHIDTAQAYENEQGVGKAIQESGLSRDEIFLTTKVKAEYKTYKEAKHSIEESLRRLNVDYVDLLLIHCPWPWKEYGSKYRYFKENLEVWKALEEAYKEGKAKSIGVSNFEIEDLKNIIYHSEIKPMANQILCHIGHTPTQLIEFCQKNNIVVESYSPIAHGAALQNEFLLEKAKQYHVSVPQLCIKYTLQLNTISIPKASSKAHVIDNTKLFFEISNEDMDELMKFNEIKIR